MKNFSKLGLMMLLAFTLILSACGKDNADGDKKKLKVSTNAAYAPMEYLEGDKVVGFDVDLIKLLAEEAGYEVEVVHTGWDAMFVEVESKIADLAIAAITIDEDRLQTYDFSVPYYLSTNKILVHEGSNIKSGDDLKDKKIAVQNGTTGQAVAEEIQGVNSSNIKKLEDVNIAIQELISGGADAVIADNMVLEEYAKNNPDQKVEVVYDESFEGVYLGVMFPKGSELTKDFSAALNTLFDNGKYTELYKKWFGVEPDVEDLKEQQ